MIFNMVIGFYFVFYPVMKRSAEDFATLIHVNASTWHKLDENKKTDLAQRILHAHQIIFSSTLMSSNAKQSTSYLPYIYLLNQKLKKRSNNPLTIDYFPAEKYQFRITLQQSPTLYVYFEKSKIGTSPPYVFLSILLSSVLISILASYFLAHRLDKYFQPLIKASIKLSKGESPNPIDITGPSEIQLLSKSFNNMSQDVQQLLENRTTLLTGVSHNLRTPVARIKLGLELLPESTDPELIKKLDRSLNEIDKIIGQFLNMAEGMSTLTPQSCSLNLLIKELISEFNHIDADISFNPTTEIHCNISVTALKQILINLIENSLRYAHGSVIEIRIQQNNQHILINVIDMGPGIPDEIKNKIFQPFVSQPPHQNNNQKNNIPQNIPGGTGLGLAICQIIAKAHHWKLSISSESGNGTCASLNIPLTNTAHIDEQPDTETH